jgi:hypothetical protein
VKDGALKWQVTTPRPPNNAPAVGKVYGWSLDEFTTSGGNGFTKLMLHHTIVYYKKNEELL